MERRLAQFLLAGVVVAAAALGAGLALWLAGASAATALMSGGLVVLMATPVLRVAFAVVEMVRARDWAFAAAAVAVLAILAASILYSGSM
jgi:hypothetical protein